MNPSFITTATSSNTFSNLIERIFDSCIVLRAIFSQSSCEIQWSESVLKVEFASLARAVLLYGH